MSHTRVHRRQFASGVSSRRALLPVWIICSLMLALFAAVFIKQYLDDRPQRSDVAVTTLNSGQDLSISTGSLTRGSIHLFTMKFAGQDLPFLIQRTDERTIHVATATCRSCRLSSKAHYARKGVFFCGQCRQPMHFESHESSSHDGCAMPEIPHSEQAGIMRIHASDVQAIYNQAFR